MTPLLVALRGLPGIGKTTLAQALGREVGWPVVDKDDLPQNPQVYELLFLEAGRLLGQGCHVICDSPLQYVSLYRLAERTAAAAGARLLVLDCTLQADEHRRRVESRRGSHLPATRITDWPGVVAYVARRSDYPIHAARLVLDLGRPLEALTGEVIAWLARDAPDA